MSQVVVTDYTFDALDIENSILQPLGCQLTAWKERRSPAELATLVSEADQVITQFAPVNAEVIAAMQRARVIVRYGIGVDNVDLVAAREQGIPVCNVPDYCIDEVADQTLAFLLAATRQVQPHSLLVRAGQWRLAVPLSSMRTLRDLTVGLIGCGRIGREVIRRLRSFGGRIVVHDPAVSADEITALGAEPVSLEQLLADSDAVSLHCPSTPQTRRLINAEALRQMKSGVILINVARGDLVDPEALTAAVQSGHVSAAALDVFDPEPMPADHPLLRMDQVVVAPHIASCSVRAVRRLRETVAQIVACSVRGEPLPNVVNGVRS